MLGRHHERTIDATRYKEDVVKCMALAPTDTDTAPDPSTLTNINQLVITISLMHVMQHPDANSNDTQLAN